MHVLTPAVHRHLGALFQSGGSVNFRNALSALASQERYLACELEGRRYDFGVKYGLLNAQLALSLAGTDRDEVLRNIVELLATRGR
jgi:UTP--glucose-1-phosphate uridylyltransferase